MQKTNRLRLLLVEDDVMVGTAIRFGLRQDDFIVDWVQDRRAAEMALQSQSYSVVVVDLGLCGKQAPALVDTLRRKKSVPVVTISAHDGAAESATALGHGNELLVTAIDLDALGTRIRNAILWHAKRAERESTTIALPFSWG